MWRYMDLYKALRPPVKTWAAKAGMKRVTSSPPAYTRLAGERHLSLWIQQSSGGFDSMLGGHFTVNLQLGMYQGIGSHLVAGRSDALITHRVDSTWDEKTSKRALELHNRIVTKRRRPPPGTPHFLGGIMSPENIERRYYLPIAALPMDYWLPFMDEDDGAAWGAFLTETLDQSFDTFLAKVHRPNPWR